MEMVGTNGSDDIDKLPDADNYLYHSFLWSWLWCGWQYRSSTGSANRAGYLHFPGNF